MTTKLPFFPNHKLHAYKGLSDLKSLCCAYINEEWYKNQAYRTWTLLLRDPHFFTIIINSSNLQLSTLDMTMHTESEILDLCLLDFGVKFLCL